MSSEIDYSFTGVFTQKVDNKGRVSIPAAFRHVLEKCDPNWQPNGMARLTFVYGLSRHAYVQCFSASSMSAARKKIRQTRDPKKKKILIDLFSTKASEILVDGTGRVVLPQAVRDKLDLEGELQFVAKLDTFQLWRPDNYALSDEDADRRFEEEYGEDTDPHDLLEENCDSPKDDDNGGAV